MNHYLRKQVRILARVLRSADDGKLSSADQKLWAERAASFSAKCRTHLARTDLRKVPGAINRVLIKRFTNSVDEISDYAETFMLGLDPEMAGLAKELSGVL